MSGSSESNEDVVAGRTNNAEDTTSVWAIRNDDDGNDFNGGAIFVAEVAADVDDPSDFPDNDWRPQHPLDGIVGTGWSANVTLGGIGGNGVVGNGGNNAGTGVVGRGSGAQGLGGGIGVHGIGGSQSDPSWDPSAPPGAGVVGQGGREAENELRLLHGAGVIGMAGGRGLPIPPFSDTGSIGVFGLGADSETKTINIDGVNTLVGAPIPGAGVLGRGGVPNPPATPADPVAAGVIGLAGGTGIPPVSTTGNTGVYGQGPTGVRGIGDHGPGVHGSAIDNRGGVFDSGRKGRPPVAQLRVVPLPPGSTTGLPKNGLPGDIFCRETLGGNQEAVVELWLCVRPAANGFTALWAPFQLGSQQFA